MNLNDLPEVGNAYETAVVAFLNAAPGSTPAQAEEFVDAMAVLLFATMKKFLEEQDDVATASH